MYSEINIDSARYFGNEAISLALQTKSDTLLANCYLVQGINFMRSWNMQSAISFFEKSEAILLKYKDTVSLARIYYHQSELFGNNRVWDQAWIYAGRLIDLAKARHPLDSTLLATGFLSLAKVYTGVSDYRKAAVFMEKSVKSLPKNEVGSISADIKIGYSDMLIAAGQHQKALEFLQELYYNRSTHSGFRKQEILEEQIGVCYAALSKTDSAVIFYKQAKKRLENKNFLRDIHRLHLRLAQAWYLAKQYDSARFYGKNAYYFFKTDQNPFLHLESIEILHKLALIDKADERSSEYFTEYIDLVHSLSEQKSIVRTHELINQYELKNKTKENEKLRLRNEYQEERFWVISVSGVLLFLAMIILFWAYRNNKHTLHQLAKQQEETESKNQALEKALHVKEKLTKMLAHDIKSPLASLEQLLILSKENLLDSREFGNFSDMLLIETTHLKTMLENTVQWVNRQNTSILVRKSDILIHPLMNQVFNLFNPSIQSKNLEIINDVPTDVRFYTDADIFTIIFRNLFSNAIKFTPAGRKIFIETKTENDKYLLTVSDQGVGMTPAELEKIARNETFSNRGTENEKGTGLGLAFIKELSSQLDETFSIQSQEGKGTQITLSFSKSQK
jgi:signal transduction histidine kinase